MNQRLKILIEHLGFTSVRSFAKHIGEDYPDKLSRLFRDSQAKLGYESLRNILTTFPEVNAEWLMIGQGPMIRGNSSHGDRIAEICTQNNLTVEMLAEQIGHSPTLLHEMINDPKIKMSKTLLIALASNFPDITLEWFEYGSSPRTHDAKDYHVFQFTVVTTKKPAIQWIASELLLF